MRKKINTLAVLTTIFATATVVFLCLFLSFVATSKTYKTQLENSYMKSFYEMVDNVNNLEVNLSKIVATSSIDSQRELLSSVYDSCRLGVNNINVLPISISKLTEINSLLNTAGGFAYSLLQSNYQGKSISNDDYGQLNSIYSKVREVQYDLNLYMQKLSYDYSILDDIDFDNEEGSSFSAGIVDSESSGTNIPSLIYDGPFSDSALNPEVSGLSDTIYTREQIEENLHSLFTGFSIYYIGESSGKFDTYNFDVKGDIDLYVTVSKRGGFILSITAFGNGNGGVMLTSDDGVELAETFASDMGIPNMYAVWNQRVGNVMYVNLAPIVNHVIYYSDLIKVKVDLSLGLVVGWEATSYATNHTSRDFTQSVGLLDAMETLNDVLEVTERNLCIIPDKYVGEISAYEFICQWNDYTYYIYIDSNTGKEVNIMRVISTSSGDLLM
ncbi:MAG: germination protein YpeB [Clostridia bacterium]|nr:germination protein YpeB [Clostridia bacterium]